MRSRSPKPTAAGLRLVGSFTGLTSYFHFVIILAGAPSWVLFSARCLSQTGHEYNVCELTINLMGGKYGKEQRVSARTDGPQVGSVRHHRPARGGHGQGAHGGEGRALPPDSRTGSEV